jgi:hypothetical protein
MAWSSSVPVSNLQEDSKPDLQDPISLASTHFSELRRFQIRYPGPWAWDNQIKLSAPSHVFKSPHCLFRQHRFAPAGLLKPSRVTAVVYFQYREVAPIQIQILFLNGRTGHRANTRYVWDIDLLRYLVQASKEYSCHSIIWQNMEHKLYEF